MRIGKGTVSVSTSHTGHQYTTTATVPRGLRVHIGHALPVNTNIAAVTLNGSPAAYELKETHRGCEIIVTTNSGQTLRLVVTIQ